MKQFLIAVILVSSFTPSAFVFADAQSLSQNVRGAESNTKGSIASVSDRTRNVFKELGISQTGVTSKNNGTEQSITGKKGDMTVQVILNEASSDLTHVGVVAKQGTVHWNRDYAKNVLSKIIQAG